MLPPVRKLPDDEFWAWTYLMVATSVNTGQDSLSHSGDYPVIFLNRIQTDSYKMPYFCISKLNRIEDMRTRILTRAKVMAVDDSDVPSCLGLAGMAIRSPIFGVCTPPLICRSQWRVCPTVQPKKKTMFLWDPQGNAQITIRPYETNVDPCPIGWLMKKEGCLYSFNKRFLWW